MLDEFMVALDKFLEPFFAGAICGGLGVAVVAALVYCAFRFGG